MRILRSVIEKIKFNESTYVKCINSAQKWYFSPISPPGREKSQLEELSGPVSSADQMYMSNF